MILQIIFVIVALITLASAVMVVTSSNLIHSALWLVAALFGVALIFGLLQAGFLAVVQVVVYIGAIAILIIFGIMLTQRIAKDPGPRFHENWRWAVVISVAMLLILGWALLSFQGFNIPAQPLDPRADPLTILGMALVSPKGYVLPFELASVLLFAALIGAIFIAWERK